MNSGDASFEHLDYQDRADYHSHGYIAVIRELATCRALSGGT
jgi:hypothetical protein